MTAPRLPPDFKHIRMQGFPKAIVEQFIGSLPLDDGEIMVWSEVFYAMAFLNGNKNHEMSGFAMPYYDRDLIEMQLAHTEKDKVRESYNRRDPYSRIEERREMMQTYANLLDYLRDRHRTKLAG